VTDEDRVGNLLQGSAKLEFWETYDNLEIYPLLENVNRTLAAAVKSGKPAASTDTATTTSQPAQGGQLAAIAGRNDSLANDTSAAAVAAANNPLFELMQPSIGQGVNGQPMLRPGATIGYVALKDTARVNAY